MPAQIGLGDPTGGILVLLVMAILALSGLVICVAGSILLIRSRGSRKKALFVVFLGLVLTSPALWFAYEMFEEDIPRDKVWDFSASRSVAQLGEEKEQEYYYYQGNIRSTVILPANKRWSGNAYLVVFKASGGQIAEIHWQTRPAPASQAYGGAKLVLIGLSMPEQELDAWYNRVSRGEQASFGILEKVGSDANVEVLVRGSVAESSWVVHANVRWR